MVTFCAHKILGTRTEEKEKERFSMNFSWTVDTSYFYADLTQEGADSTLQSIHKEVRPENGKGGKVQRKGRGGGGERRKGKGGERRKGRGNDRKSQRKGRGNDRTTLSKRGFQPCGKNADSAGIMSAQTPMPADVASLSDSDDDSDQNIGGKTDDLAATSTETTTKKKKRRYLLFVGNMPLTTSQEDIVSHFEKRGVRIKDFRLLSHKDTGKSKGCGFMELFGIKGMQNAIKFHRTRMEGKHINVEVTCGGGGKTAARKAKITKKNRTLRRKKALANPFKQLV